MLKYKLCYKLRKKEHIIKSNNKIELINKLIVIKKLTNENIKYMLYEYTLNYNTMNYYYKNIAGYTNINY